MRESNTTPSSWLSRWDPRHKLIAGLFVMIVAATVQSVVAATTALLLALLLLKISACPLRELTVQCGAAALFLLPCLIILPFTVNGTSIVISGVPISLEGIELALVIYLRALAVIVVAMAMIRSTSVPVLLRAAEQFWCPKLLVQIALLAYRYVFSLQREWQRVKDALRTRAFRNRSSWHAYNTWASVVGMTLIRSNERTQRLCDAMQCRGYRGTLMALTPLPRYPSDGLKTTLIVASGCILLGIDTLIGQGYL